MGIRYSVGAIVMGLLVLGATEAAAQPGRGPSEPSSQDSPPPGHGGPGDYQAPPAGGYAGPGAVPASPNVVRLNREPRRSGWTGGFGMGMGIGDTGLDATLRLGLMLNHRVAVLANLRGFADADNDFNSDGGFEAESVGGVTFGMQLFLTERLSVHGGLGSGGITSDDGAEYEGMAWSTGARYDLWKRNNWVIEGTFDVLGVVAEEAGVGRMSVGLGIAWY